MAGVVAVGLSYSIVIIMFFIGGVDSGNSSIYRSHHQQFTSVTGSDSQEGAYSETVNITHTNSSSNCAPVGVHFKALSNDPCRVNVDHTAFAISLEGLSHFFNNHDRIATRHYHGYGLAPYSHIVALTLS